MVHLPYLTTPTSVPSVYSHSCGVKCTSAQPSIACHHRSFILTSIYRILKHLSLRAKYSSIQAVQVWWGGYPKVLACFLGVNTRPQEKVRGQLTISFSLRDDVNRTKMKAYSKSNDTVLDKIR